MISPHTKTSKQYDHPAFKGLTESQLVTLYNIGSVKKIKAGSVLVKEEDPDPTIYPILKGSARILKKMGDKVRQIAIVGQGDCVPQIPSLNGHRRTGFSAIALEPLTVFVLDDACLNGLPGKMRSAVYENLERLSGEQINGLIAKQMELSDRNARLTSHLADFLQAGTQEYVNSEMIQSFLKRVPRLPVFASRLAVLLLDENVSTRDVAQLAKLDPSLVGMVLKRINSAYYGFQHEISDFQHAVLLLGFNQVYQMIVDMGIRSTMPKTPAFRELQFHSMMVSFIGFEMCQLYKVGKAALVSTIGLLHDIGKSVILLLRQRNPKMTFLVDMLDHTKIGSLLLEEWNIPDVVCKSLEYQSYPALLPPETIPEEYRTNVTVLYMAHLCYEYLLGRSESELPTAFFREYGETVGCPEKSIAELVEKRLIPSMNKKHKTFPEAVQDFLTTSQENIVGREKETPKQ
ncbi:MAG TPA: HDOD domain-containing protein [Desulfobacterales bacterium]|nr:HDOD domain-containing protein [Desulfobacterales bacterium]